MLKRWAWFVTAILASGALGATSAHPGQTPANFKRSLRQTSRQIDGSGIYNSLIAAQVGPNGRFNFGANPNGGSALVGPNSFNLSFNWPSVPGTSFSTVQLDGVNYVYGTDGILTVAPNNVNDTNVSAWLLLPNVLVTQTLSLAVGPNSGRADAVRVQYQINNLDTMPHSVGLRIMIDTMLNGNDAAPFRIPGLGDVTNETLLTGAAVPSYWQAFNSLANAAIASQGTLRGADATTPDRFGVFNWSSIDSQLWDYTPPLNNPTGDSAVAMWWDPVNLAPGGALTLVTYYGLGSQTVVTGGSLAVGITAPAGLKPADGPVDINVVVQNVGGSTATGARAHLDLPSGLVLTTAVSPSFDVALGDLRAGSQAAASWRIQLGSGAINGPATFTVTASSTSPSVAPVSASRALAVSGVVVPVLALPSFTAPATVKPADGPFAVSATFKNTGGGVAPAVNAHLTLPAGLVLVTGGPGADIQLGDLAAGAQATANWQVQLGLAPANGPVNLSVTGTSTATGLAPASGQRSVTIDGVTPPSLGLVTFDAPTRVQPSDGPFNVTVTLRNNGYLAAPQVVAHLDLPAQYVLDDPTGQPFDRPLGDLAGGQQVAVAWRLRVAAEALNGVSQLAFRAASSLAGVAPLTATHAVTLANALADPATVDVAHSQVSWQPDHLILPSPASTNVQTTVGLTIALVDGSNAPVVNLAPGHLQVVATPADPVTITQPSVATDAQGTTTAQVATTTAGQVHVTVLLDGQPLAAALDLTIVTLQPVTETYDLAPGLHLLANSLLYPKFETDPLAGGDLTAWRWDPVSLRYVQLTDSTALVPGEAFFVRVRTATHAVAHGFAALPVGAGGVQPTVALATQGAASIPAQSSASRQATGVQVPTGPPVVTLLGEWNLIGFPFLAPFDWNLADLEVVVDGQSKGTLDDRSTWAFVSPYAFVFNGSSYRLVFDSTLPGFEQALNQVPVLAGAWVRRVPSAQTIQLRRKSLTATRAVGTRSASAGSWGASLTATAGGYSSTVTIGVDTALTRSLVIGAPPALADAPLAFSLVSGTSRLRGEVRTVPAPTQSWTASVEAPAGQDVTLSWAGLSRALPAGCSATLIDLETGRRQALRTTTAWRFVSRGTPRLVQLELGRPPTGGLQVQVAGAATRSRGASLTLTLTAPARVQAEVTSLSGRVVRSLPAVDAAAGQTAVAWDGLDDQGRPVPAGVYRLVATAWAVTGEIARATTVITVR